MGARGGVSKFPGKSEILSLRLASDCVCLETSLPLCSAMTNRAGHLASEPRCLGGFERGTVLAVALSFILLHLTLYATRDP